MIYPSIPVHTLLQRLQPPTGRVSMILDTDTYNEVDDQFALAFALLSPERLQVEAVYATPFHNERSAGPADGMEKSYQEMLRLLTFLNLPHDNFAFRGATAYLDPSQPKRTPAVDDLIRRAMARTEYPLYVVAIGALTNIATAILLELKIIEQIVVLWLGGHALHWNHTREFNLKQDIPAARILFDCGVPLVQVPCLGVASHLQTSVPELEFYLSRKNSLCDFLVHRVKEYQPEHYAWSKVIWDIAPVAWLIHSEWVPSELVHSPILSDQATWSVDRSRHLIRSAAYVDRDPIFRDLFSKLTSANT